MKRFLLALIFAFLSLAIFASPFGLKMGMIIVIITLFIFLGINAPKIKGWFGEKNIARRLNTLEPDKYINLNDILLKTENGNTCQIDHLVISVYGLFVIETKNYKGWIFGHENSENWSQVIYNRKSFFRNPIKQNWSHIYALKYVLKDFPNLRYVPIVVFAGSASLKKIVSNVSVIYDFELIRFIKEYPVEKSISNEEVQKIASFLQSLNIEGKENRKEHVENIHRTVTGKQLKKENLICPRCNSELKLREGKYGKFYGCSNYPYCKFTVKY